MKTPTFNKIVTDETGAYTVVCSECLNEYGLAPSNNSAIGLCEVYDCLHEAEYVVEVKTMQYKDDSPISRINRKVKDEFNAWIVGPSMDLTSLDDIKTHTIWYDTSNPAIQVKAIGINLDSENISERYFRVEVYNMEGEKLLQFVELCEIPERGDDLNA